jgi:KDO2-lipid IV(A) lauroyltransferase
MSWFFTLFSRLPLSVLYGFGFIVYLLVYRIFRVRKDVVLANLGNAFPDLTTADVEDLARRVYRNYSDVLMEMIKSLTMSGEDLIDRVCFDNLELIEKELECGRPVLLTLAHHGNIEWLLLALCCKLDYPVEAIYRPVSSTWVEEMATRTYTRFGGVLIDDGSVVREIMQRKQTPRVVAIVSDQAPNIDDHSVWVTFLNQETAFYLAPDTIARFTGYPVCFLSMKRTSRGRYTARFDHIAQPPYAGRDRLVINAYIKNVDEQIQDCPEDWLWLHKRWKRKRSVYE